MYTDKTEKRVATLMGNDLIAKNLEIVKQVIDNSEVKKFHKGQKIIEQGEFNDDVFFILTGDVKILRDGNQIDVRIAPQTIGEMSAMKPENPRNADVVVESKTCETLRISGTFFRILIDTYPTFHENMNEFTDKMARSKIEQLGNKKNEKFNLKNITTKFLRDILGNIYNQIIIIISGIILSIMYYISQKYFF